MKKHFLGLSAFAAVLLASAAPALAQTPAPAAYTGPRYPGGVDSLRALLYRSIRQLSPSPAGLAVARVELKDGREPADFKLIGTPQPASKALSKASEAALAYLRAQMRAWQPGAPDPDAKPGRNPRFLFALEFGAPASAQPYPYADQEPVFPDLAALLRAQHNVYFEHDAASPATLANLASTSKGLSTYVQMQVRYPPAALRQQQQGVVHVYFEIAATGAIEHPKIIGSAGDALDEEVLRVVQQLPAAATPALLLGKPVAVFYVLPITFKIQ